MNSVATSLMGQSLAVVQSHLGPALKHQHSAEKHTDFYLHGTPYLETVFPVAIAGIVSVFRHDHCVALRIIFDQQDPRLAEFVYTPAIAQHLFTKIAGDREAQWHPLESTRTAANLLHHVCCLGNNIATTWDASPADSTLVNDIIVYFERRCSVTTQTVVSPLSSDITAVSADNAAILSSVISEGKTVPSTGLVFPDIATNPYRAEIIKAANIYGLVGGYDDGKFHPTAVLSREQAVALLVNALQYRLPAAVQIPKTLSEPPPFPDVKAGWSATRIQFAKATGLISGDSSGLFRPLDQLSRAALIAMIHKGLSFIVRQELGASVALAAAIAPVENPPAPFPDVSTTHWAYALIEDLRPTGIVSADRSDSTGYRFNPDQAAHRDYATAAMVRLVESKLVAPSAFPSPDHPLHDPNPAPEVNFPDIKGNPYEPQIHIAANQYQLVSGFVDGTFRPHNSVTREQAVVILLDALRERLINESVITLPDQLTERPFVDVAVDRWSAPKLAFAKQAGIVAGDASGAFAPEAPVSRAQLMAIAHQALAYGVWQDFGRHSALDQIFKTGMVDTYNFVDIPNNHWAANILPVMSVLGLAHPQDFAKPNIFAPDAPAKRDYAVAIAVQMVQLMYTDMPNPVEEHGFRDIENDPYEAEISRAANQYRLVNIPEDGYFHPLDMVRRDAIAAMLVKAITPLVSAPGVINLPASLSEAPFSDVPADHPAAPQIKFVTDVGIMDANNDSAGQFAPQGTMTRADLMAAIANAAQFVAKTNFGEGVNLAAVVYTSQTTPSALTDIDGHSAEPAIAQMAQLGIALPYPPGSSEFMPEEPCRRNYATAAMVRLRELPFQQ